MSNYTFQFSNPYGIQFSRLKLPQADKRERVFFKRFRGVTLPGKSTCEIGRGGSGVIYSVVDEQISANSNTERLVALKTPLELHAADDQLRIDIRNEAMHALELSHPNIVRVYDYHEEEQVRWGISMQYVHGRNLDQLRRSDAPNRIEVSQLCCYDVDDRVRSWLKQLCDALSYVHEDAGVAHCDIKPKNLMVERSIDTKSRVIRDHLLVMDFGISQKLRNTLAITLSKKQTAHPGRGELESGGALGTLAYMSPQQLKGAKGTVADDIYAVGVTIYELLTGRLPFYQGDEKLVHPVESQKPDPMSKSRRDRGYRSAGEIPDPWEEAVQKCLSINPDDRPRSARELAELLGLEAPVGGSVRPSGAILAKVAGLEQKVREMETERERLLTGLKAKVQALEEERDALIRQQDAEVPKMERKIRELEGQRDLLRLKMDEQGQSTSDREEGWAKGYEQLQSEVEHLRQQIAERQRAAEEAGRQLQAVRQQFEQAEQEKLSAQERIKAAQVEVKASQQEVKAAQEQVKSAHEKSLAAKASAQAEIREQLKSAEAESEAALKSIRDQAKAEVKSALNQTKAAEDAAKTAQEQARASAERAEALRRKSQEDLEKARKRAEELQVRVDASTDTRLALVRPVAMVFLGLILLGIVCGFAVSRLFSGSQEIPLAQITQRLHSEEVKTNGYEVKARDVRIYLRAIGVEEKAVAPELSQLKDDDRVTGLSWLTAMSFCEWLTQAAGYDPAKHWFDLPQYEDLKKLGTEPEWTREEISTGEKGARQAMRIYDRAKPERSAARAEAPPDVGFRCWLRGNE